MTTVHATARRWDRGWELWIGGEAATQVDALENAEAQVRDYLDTIEPDTDHSQTNVEIAVELGELSERIRSARDATVAASRAQEDAAMQSRTVARALRGAHLSLADSAFILGISKARVSQLAKTESA